MRRIVFIMVCFVAGVFGAARVGLAAGPLNGLTPKFPSQLLNITNFLGKTCSCKGSNNGSTLTTRANPDGSNSPFSIPSGQVLVVTGMTWSALTSGDSGGFMSLCVDTNEVWLDTAVAGSDGEIGRSLQLAPLVFKSGHELCGGGNVGNKVLLTGFLTKDN